jgi:hypothetical protein
MGRDEREMTPEVQEILAKALAVARTNAEAFLGARAYERLDDDAALDAALEAKLEAEEQRLAKAFARFDLNGDGVVSVEEIQEILGLDRIDAEAFVAQFDRDGDERVDYQEFLLASFARQGLKIVDDGV